jgi:hypothetical protein
VIGPLGRHREPTPSGCRDTARVTFPEEQARAWQNGNRGAGDRVCRFGLLRLAGAAAYETAFVCEHYGLNAVA